MPENQKEKDVESGEGSHQVERPVLSTGSTLLNLACSNDSRAGLLTGKYYLIVGDATAGKTFLAMTVLAEASRNSEFADYHLIYDNIEDGCLLDLDKLFGASLRKRLQSPGQVNEDTEAHSSTIEEFYFSLDTALQKGPVIYVLDSMDALTSSQEDEHFEQLKKAAQQQKAVAGSFGVSKARKNSEYLRRILGGLRETKSILLILSQTRDNLSFGFAKKIRSGGHALRFYATLEIWASVVKKIKRSIRGKDRVVGVKVRWEVRKNRITGRLGKVEFDIYPSYGIDDLGSCLDYLVGEGLWKLTGRSIDAPALTISGNRDVLLKRIEAEGLVEKVQEEVGVCWAEIESLGELQRKKRYMD